MESNSVSNFTTKFCTHRESSTVVTSAKFHYAWFSSFQIRTVIIRLDSVINGTGITTPHGETDNRISEYLREQLLPKHLSNKIDVKRQNTNGCLDQYVCRGLRLWNSRGSWSSLGLREADGDSETVWAVKQSRQLKLSWLLCGWRVNVIPPPLLLISVDKRLI